MNREKMAGFLLTLRKESKLTQKDLADEFYKYDQIVSEVAISSWENAKTIPNLDKLLILSDLYKVSLDELLDGERYVKENYEEKYLLAKDNWLSYLEGDTNSSNLWCEQVIKIKEKFKSLVKKFVVLDWTRADEEEFRFLFAHFYTFSNDFEEHDHNNFEMSFSLLKQEMYKRKLETANLSDEEKVWELQKLVFPKDALHLNRVNLPDYLPKEDSDIDKLIKSLEFWEKDILLATFQNDDFLFCQRDGWGATALIDYEKKFGKKYDKEQIQKDLLKYLLNNGARLNSCYMNSIHREQIDKRIIDYLEDLYVGAIKPMDVYVLSENIKHFKVANTKKNRFVKKYFYNLSCSKLKLSIAELYNYWEHNDEIPKELLWKLAEANNIDLTQDEYYIMADLKIHERSFFDFWQESKENEKRLEVGKIEFNDLLDALRNNQDIYVDVVEHFIGGHTFAEVIDFCYRKNQSISKTKLLNARQKKRTIELLNEIDNLSVAEIKAKYFKMEVYDID